MPKLILKVSNLKPHTLYSIYPHYNFFSLALLLFIVSHFLFLSFFPFILHVNFYIEITYMHLKIASKMIFQKF